MDETQDVGIGAEGTTTPPVSKPIESAPQQSQELLEIKKALELTRSELKGLQSRQDKEQNEVQRFMGEVKKRMAKGMSLEEAEQAVTAENQAAQKDELLYKIAQKVGVLDSPSAQSPAGNGLGQTVDVASTLSQYGLNENDPDVAAALASEKDVEKAALRVALRRSKQPHADVSASTSAQGKPTSPTNGEQLKAEYIQKIRAARGQRREIKALQEEYSKKGVDIYTVDPI